MDIDPERRVQLLLMTAEGRFALAREAAEFGRPFNPSKWFPYTLKTGKRAGKKVYRTEANAQIDELPEGYVEHEEKVKHISEVPGMAPDAAARPGRTHAEAALTTLGMLASSRSGTPSPTQALDQPPPPPGQGEPWGVKPDTFLRAARQRGIGDRTAREAHYQSVAGAIRQGQPVPWDHVMHHYPRLSSEGLAPALRARAVGDLVANRGVPDEMEVELRHHNEHPEQVQAPTPPQRRVSEAVTSRPAHIPLDIERQMSNRWRTMNRGQLERTLKDHEDSAERARQRPGEMFQRQRQGFLYWAHQIRQEMARRQTAHA